MYRYMLKLIPYSTDVPAGSLVAIAGGTYSWNSRSKYVFHSYTPTYVSVGTSDPEHEHMLKVYAAHGVSFYIEDGYIKSHKRIEDVEYDTRYATRLGYAYNGTVPRHLIQVVPHSACMFDKQMRYAAFRVGDIESHMTKAHLFDSDDYRGGQAVAICGSRIGVFYDSLMVRTAEPTCASCIKRHAKDTAQSEV